MRNLTFPRDLDAPHRILFWSVDEMVVLFICIAIGIVQERIFTCMVIGLVLMHVYRHFRNGNPAGFLLHVAYWYGLVSLKGRRDINVFARKIIP